jgi:hypothetical protein
MIRIHNVEKNEIIDREMNDAELTQWETHKAASEAEAKAATANIVAKAALLERLGITADEAALLLG